MDREPNLDPYKRLFETMLDGAVVLDVTTGRIALANKAAARIFGFPSPEEMVGLNPLDYVPQEDQERIAQMIVETLERDPAAPYEVRIFTRDKRIVWVSASATHIEYEGRKATFTTIRDITSERARDAALRDAERRYENLFDGMMDGAVVLDISTFQIAYANKAAAEMFGFSSPREVVGENPLSYIPEDDRDEVARQIALNLQGEGKNPAEIRVITRDKRNLWVSATASTIDYEGRTATLTTLRDITADKAKDAALKAAEEGKLQLIDAAAESIFVVQDWKMVYVNPAGAAVAGLSQKDMIGVSFQDFVHPDQRAALTERYERLLAGRWSSDFTTVKGIDAKGETRWAEIREIPYSWQGRPAVMSLVHDITDRMRADVERKEREERFRSIIENAWDGITILDENYKVIFESPSLARISGYTPEEWMGRPVGQMSIHPDDLVWLASRMETLKSQPDSVIRDVVVRYQHKDGSWRWIEATGRNLLHDPRVKGLVVNFRDITERKRTEDEGQRLSTAIEQAADIVVVTDREGVIQYVNPAFTKITGYTSDEAIGQNPRVLKSGRHDQGFYRNLWDTITAGKTWTGHFLNKKKDGSLYNEEATISPIRNASGEITNFVAVKHDVTERLRTAEALENSEQRFRALIENATDAVAIVGPNGEILYESPAARRISGYTTEEMVGHYVTEYIAPEDLGRVADLFVDLKGHPGKAVPPFQMGFRHADGSLHTAEMTIQNLVHVPGIGGAVVNYRDITERLKIEEALKHSEERFRTLIEKAADVVIVLDATGKITYQSPSLERVTGFGHDEWLGRPLDQLLIHPDDMLSLTTLLERVLNQPGATVEGVTARYQHKDGSWHTLEATVTNMLHDPNVAGIVANFRDITDRKEAEEKLRGSEDLYRSLVLISPDAVTVSDLKGDFTFVSPQTARLHGYDSTEELLGKSAFELTAPEDQAKAASALEAMLTEGFVRNVESTFLRKDGSRFIGELSAALIRDANGDPHSIIGYTRDITDRKAAQQALTESEQKYRLLVENSTDVIFSLDTQGNFTYVSPAIERISGYRVDEVVGTSFVRFVMPEDLPALMASFERTLAGAAELSEFRAVLKDGTIRHVQTTSRVVMRDGKRVGLTGIMSDITQRKKAEEALRASEERNRLLIDNAAEVVTVVQDGLIKFINRKVIDLAGYSPEELVSKPFIELIHPDDRQTVADNYVKRLSGGEVPATYQMRVIHKNGDTRWAATSVALFTWEGRPATLGLLSDITDRKQAEAEILALSNAFRATLDPVLILDLQGNVRNTNEAAKRLFETDELGIGALKYVVPEDEERIASAMQDLIAGGRATVDRFSIVTRSGRRVPIEASASLMLDANGKPVGIVVVERDITERRKVEETLRASEEKYRLVADSTNDEIWTSDINLHTTYVSPSVERLLGFTVEERMKQDVMAQMTPESFAKAAEALTYHLALEEDPKADPNRVLRIELEYYRKDGSTVWLENQVSGIRDASGELVGFHGVARDVTERKKAEEQSKASEQKYRLLTEKTADIIWTTDLSLRSTYVSPSIEKVLGFTPEERLTQDLETQMTPASYARVQARLQEELSLEEGGHYDPERTVDIETEYYHKNGSTVWMENLVSAIRDQAGHIVGVHGVSRDVSDRRRAQEALKESEERFRTLIEKSTDAIAILDSSGNLLYESPSMERITGYKLEDWIGKPVGDWLLHPDDLAAMASLLEKVLTQPDAISEEVSVRFKHRDGTWHFLEGTVRNLLGDPKVKGLVINYRDITERRLADEAVKESEKKFRALFDSANDGIFIHRLTGYFLEVNEIACRQLGYTREEMLRLTPGDIDAPEYATKVPERTEELVRNGQAVFETAHLAKDGRVIPIEANSRIVDFGGKPAVLTIARDVTERKKAQEALLASEADYRNLFHQTLLGMEVVDGQTGKVMLANRAIATMFGFNSPEEMVGLDAITGWVLPEDMEWVIREFARVMAEPAKRDVATLRVRGKDGRIVWVSASGTFFDYEGKPAILISLIDVTAAKEAEDKLRDSEEKNRLLIDNSIEAISVIQDGAIKFANRRFAESVGFSAQELVSRSFADFIHPDDRQRVAEYYFKRMSGEEAPSSYQFRWIDREEADHWGEASVAILNWEGRPATLCMLSDITERVEAEQAVRESESRFRALVQNVQDIILIMDIDGKVVFENPATAATIGESLLGKIGFDVIHPEDVSNAKRAFNDVVNRVNDDSPLHIRMRRVDASWLDMEVLGANLLDDISVRGMLVVCRDVTLRLKAQRELRDSEERFRALIEEATDAVAILEPSGKTVYYSPSMRRVTGYTPEEWAGKSLGDLLIHPDDLVSLASLLEEMKQPNATAEGITVRYVHKDGLWHTLEATVRNMIHDPKIGGIVANFRDVTERVKAEQALKESEERFRGLVETTSDWVWEIDRHSRYTYVSPKVRDILGHEPRELLGHTPFEFMHQREGRRVSKIVRRFADAHLPFSLLENTCIHKDGHSVALETSAVPILDSDGGFLGYRGIDRDITERKKVEQELQRSLKRLEKTMESTIEAITTTIETRDPYTTGHQMRVTDLACAIAKVMEVPPTQIEGIRVAGLLHDIGKIAIPTEILSKPGKLTEVEFSMIKTHAKTGYNILKKIEFAWPVAKAVLQHHERWNGSGYPHGIRGEDILLEARILAVADVMEAMASHRPYRPSVGLDKALEEVSKNSGILYDPAVAKACETAFARDGFKFVSAVPGVVAESGSTSSDRPVHSPEDR